MARPKSYGSAAEKQRAYRARLKNLAGVGSDLGTAGKYNQPTSGVTSVPPAANLPAVSVLTESAAGEKVGKTNESGEARESNRTVNRVPRTDESPSKQKGTDSCGGGQRPSYIPEKEWVLACERAERARKYAGLFPQFVKVGEEVYQDAVWQWENEVRGRFGGVVGGSLSGTRGERI